MFQPSCRVPVERTHCTDERAPDLEFNQQHTLWIEISSKGNFEAKMTEIASDKSYFSPEYEYPAFGDCSYDKYIVGVAENFKKGYCQF